MFIDSSNTDGATDPFVYRVIIPEDWAIAQQQGHVPAVAIDRKDGYFHLSPHDQILTTAKLYFTAEQSPAVLELEAEQLGASLVWETVAERGGRNFPHYYGDTLPLTAVTAFIELDAQDDGSFQFGRRIATSRTPQSAEIKSDA